MSGNSNRKKIAILCGIILGLFILTATDIKKEDELGQYQRTEAATNEIEDVTVIPITKEESIVLPNMVRVVLTNDNGRTPLRDGFQIKSSTAVTVTAGETVQNYGANTVFSKEMLAGLLRQSDCIRIVPNENQSLYLLESESGSWSAPYRGVFYIYQKDDKYWIVNELPLEEYLLGVVPGEMPERFSIEALKAQAVCARTYVCNMIEKNTYEEYHADVDDSVECQVYNKHGENEKATKAVLDTAGVVLLEQKEAHDHVVYFCLADIYYFSTSCGFTTGLEVWGEETLPYLTSVSTLKSPEVISDWDTYLKRTDVEAYDSGSNYFRWTATVRLPEGYSLSIDKREASGAVTQISIKSKNPNDTTIITTENEVRTILGSYTTSLLDLNKDAISMDQLPSAWFTIEKGQSATEYILSGGGYGHGIGMSQYGAHGMAEDGMNYKNILTYYFPGTKISK